MHRIRKGRNYRRTNRLIHEQGGFCPLCSLPLAIEDANIDHILPRSKGGGEQRYNLQATHTWCNTKKGDEVRPEQIAKLRIAPPPKLHPLDRVATVESILLVQYWGISTIEICDMIGDPHDYGLGRVWKALRTLKLQSRARMVYDAKHTFNELLWKWFPVVARQAHEHKQQGAGQVGLLHRSADCG